MSKTIRELETGLGVALFERGPRGVKLTPAGRTLLRHAAPALRSIGEGIEAVRREEPEPVVRLGALSNVEGGLLPETLLALHRERPDIRVEVDTGTSAALLTRLRLGELDLVVGRMSEAEEIRDLVFEHLYYEPMIVVVRAEHPALADTGSRARYQPADPLPMGDPAAWHHAARTGRTLLGGALDQPATCHRNALAAVVSGLCSGLGCRMGHAGRYGKSARQV